MIKNTSLTYAFAGTSGTTDAAISRGAFSSKNKEKDAKYSQDPDFSWRYCWKQS